MLRFVAPAGAPVKVSQILQAAQKTAFRKGNLEENIHALAGLLKARHLFGVSSGRAALTLILKAMHRLLPERAVVVLPAYTCYTVAGAIVRAGLKLYPVEIDPATLDFDPRHLEAIPRENILCILTSNLFGFVNNPGPIREAAESRGAFIVDDAAQALGGVRCGTNAGLLGDAGFYSLGRGKALAAMEGGLIVTNSDAIAAAIQEEASSLPEPGGLHSVMLLLQLLAYAIFLRPRLFWIPNSMPFLKFGTTEFDTQFPARRLPRLVWNLLPGLMQGLEKINRVRRDNAAHFASAMDGHPFLAAARPAESSFPNYIRFPVVAINQSVRDRAVRALRAEGIGATPFYPGAICDIEGIASHMALRDYHCPAAEDLGRRLLTIPTHPYVTASDVENISVTLRRLELG